MTSARRLRWLLIGNADSSLTRQRSCAISATPCDQNLSRLVADVYTGSAHVHELGLESADGLSIWRHKGQAGFTIGTKDDDFRQWSFPRGEPPKVVWVRLGNCTTHDVELLLRWRREEVISFAADELAAFLVFRHKAI